MKNILLILLIIISASSAECLAYRFVDIGDLYPPFCAKQYNGDRICSRDYSNKLVVFTFFTLNNSHSQKTLIDLQDIHVKYARNNVSVIGILSGDVNLHALDKFIKVNKITFPILLDNERQIYGSFGVFVYPSTGIFSTDGKLRYYLPARRVNFKKHIEGYIRFLLGKISEHELQHLINPPIDKVSPGYKKAENYYNFAKISFKKGKLAKAKKLLDLSIRHYDKYASSYSLYGYIYIQEEEYQLGLEKFESALTIAPDLQEAIAGKQICLDNLKKTDAD